MKLFKLKNIVFLFVLLLFNQHLFSQSDSDTLKQKQEKHSELTVEAFNELVKGKFILVYLHADWCAICKKQQPILDKVMKEESGRIEFLDLDTEANPLINEHFEVDGLPRIILYKKDKIIWQYVGLIQEKDLRDWIKSF